MSGRDAWNKIIVQSVSRPNVDDDEKAFSAFSLLLAAEKAFMFLIRKKTTDKIGRTRPVVSKNTEIKKG